MNRNPTQQKYNKHIHTGEQRPATPVGAWKTSKAACHLRRVGCVNPGDRVLFGGLHKQDTTMWGSCLEALTTPHLRLYFERTFMLLLDLGILVSIATHGFGFGLFGFYRSCLGLQCRPNYLMSTSR